MDKNSKTMMKYRRIKRYFKQEFNLYSRKEREQMKLEEKAFGIALRWENASQEEKDFSWKVSFGFIKAQ